MKRLLLILVVLHWVAGWSIGQQVFGFETWNSSGSEPPFDWEQPKNCTSTNKLTEFIDTGIKTSADAHEGNKAVLLSSLKVFDTNVAGSLVLSDCNIDYVGQKILYEGSGIPIDKKMSLVSAWYKYDNANNDGAGLMEILITRWHTINHTRELLLHKKIDLTKTLNYKQVTADLATTNFQPMSDSIIIIFRSDREENPFTDSGRLLVDDVRLEYSTAAKDQIREPGIHIYPNPVQRGAALCIDSDRTVRSGEVYDLAGRLARRVVFGTGHKEMVLPDPGTYIVKILYTEGPATLHKLLVK